MQTKEILKELRKKNGYSAQEVADGCSMSLGVYKKYESGERGVGTPALCKLADFYGVTTDYLLGRDIPERAKKMTIEEMEQDILNRWLELGTIGRELVLNALRSIINLADAKESEKAEEQKQITHQAPIQPIIQSNPPIQQQPVQPPVVQSSPQSQLQQPNLQRQMPVQQPVSTEPPPQSQIQIDPKNPCRFTARRTDGRYESRLATPEEIEKLRLALEDSENGPKPEY